MVFATGKTNIYFMEHVDLLLEGGQRFPGQWMDAVVLVKSLRECKSISQN